MYVDSATYGVGLNHPVAESGVQSSSGIASIRSRWLACWRTVMEKRT